MTQSPFVTLAAGLAGAAVGLIVPFISASFNRRGVVREVQRETADRILDLLTDHRLINEFLGGPHNAARRQLYILGLRLRDRHARLACMDLVARAGSPGVTEDALYPAWHQTLKQVSRVSRGDRKDDPDAKRI